VRRLYQHLARAYPIADWTMMNYGYAPLVGEPWSAPAAEGQEQTGCNLYWRIATSGQRGLTGLDVLEIGSGRGGGAAFLTRVLRPRRYVGLDVAEAAVALASRRYGEVAGLTFTQGDAENLTLPDSSVDVVLNIESAHGYASVPRFLAGVGRVLRPGGELRFAGFAERGAAQDWLVAALRAAPMTLVRLDDITANIVAALALDEARKRTLIALARGPLMRSFATGAYAMEGTAMRRALESRKTVYLAAVLTR
jgi:SAM-dependent methyltransferase